MVLRSAAPKASLDLYNVVSGPFYDGGAQAKISGDLGSNRRLPSLYSHSGALQRTTWSVAGHPNKVCTCVCACVHTAAASVVGHSL